MPSDAVLTAAGLPFFMTASDGTKPCVKGKVPMLR